MFALIIYTIHILINFISGVLLMRGYYPNDNALEKNNPKKKMYKRFIAISKLVVSLLGILSVKYGIDTLPVREIVSPTLFLYHLLSNMVQWNNGASSTMSAIISPHLFLSLGFGRLILW
jgi:hypothetical protein